MLNPGKQEEIKRFAFLFVLRNLDNTEKIKYDEE